MKKELYLYHREKKVKTLGPGERYVLWVQGCIHNCPNCIAPETHSIDTGGYFININEILEEIREDKAIQGVTVSGGEPFLQAENLIFLLKEIKKIRLNIICYTGFLYEDILKDKISYGKELLKYIDVLIDGKYIDELNNDNYLRGSENQRIIHLSNVFKKHKDKMNELKNRNIEVRILDNTTIFITGIPPKALNKDWGSVRKKIYGSEEYKNERKKK